LLLAGILLLFAERLTAPGTEIGRLDE
jgi:hypothetical protein